MIISKATGRIEMKNNRFSQEKKILTWLSSGRTLTPIQALIMFGCFRLSARIYDLRKQKRIKIKNNPIEKDGKRFGNIKWRDKNDKLFIETNVCIIFDLLFCDNVYYSNK